MRLRLALRCSWRFLVPRMYSEHSDAKIMKCNRYLKQNFPLKPLLQGELILSRCSLPYELPFPDTEVSKSVFIAQNQPLRCFGAGVAVPKTRLEHQKETGLRPVGWCFATRGWG